MKVDEHIFSGVHGPFKVTGVRFRSGNVVTDWDSVHGTIDVNPEPYGEVNEEVNVTCGESERGVDVLIFGIK